MEKLKKKLVPVSFRFVCLLWVFLLLFTLFTFSHKFVVISGNSMEPTLRDHEIVLVSKCTSISIGDIYVVSEPVDGYRVVKRLLGGPGDTIDFKDGALYRNDVKEQEATGNSWDNYHFELGADEYLFVGDNRKDSYDGRHWGRAIKLEEIEYHVDYILYPFSRFGAVKEDTRE